MADLCQHGNPMELPCKLCKRQGNVPPEMLGVAPPADFTPYRSLLAHAYGLLESVDTKKAGPDWVASYAEWKETWAGLDSTATIVASPQVGPPVEAPSSG